MASKRRNKNKTQETTENARDRSQYPAINMGGDDGRKSREKDDLEDERRTALLKERDREMERLVDQKKTKKRSKSLLEMHQKVLKKKKEKKLKEEGGKEERRPFDRNVDLQANRLDEAQRKAVFKKARLLDTRFATGESKYL
ncbi:hypothetical protein AAG570_009977 [Ranatra chinensis]|uniref:DUF3752 domain-containing protein n=1 Tax=Ranatra chinensis TaxID=642074 RepID=A0ABD0YSU6_9HEMI